MTTTTNTRTEYGFRVTGGEMQRARELDVWPRDGKLRPYGNPSFRGAGSIPEGVDATDLPALHAAAKRFVEVKASAGQTRTVAVISRTVRTSTTVVETPSSIVTVIPAPVELPTAPGSVVRAALGDEDRALWTLTPDTDSQPWNRLGYHYRGNWAGASDLKDVEVLFDAATA